MSAPMLAQAQAIDRNAGLSLRYVNARAEDTGLVIGELQYGTCGLTGPRQRANRVGYSSAMGTLPVRGGTFTSMNITLLSTGRVGTHLHAAFCLGVVFLKGKTAGPIQRANRP